jgi:hypothetical protein
LEALTKRTRSDAQIRALRFMGIEHKVRPDGSVAVLRGHVETTFGQIQPKGCNVKEVEPNWSAM